MKVWAVYCVGVVVWSDLVVVLVVEGLWGWSVVQGRVLVVEGLAVSGLWRGSVVQGGL